MKEKRREESYAERIGESGAEAGWELLSRRHLEEGRPAPLPSYLKQHPLSLSLSLSTLSLWFWFYTLIF